MLKALQKRKLITLKGSAELVTEFFDYSINSILFQRGLYPPEDFKSEKKYGLNMQMISDDKVKVYLSRILSQVHNWVASGKISKLIMAVTSCDTRDVIERWQFNIKLDEQTVQTTDHKNKDVETIQQEIGAIMRQIVASVTFLPMITAPCTFNVLAYTSLDADVPDSWIDSDAKLVDPDLAQQVQLRGFTTGIHQVGTTVSYKLGDFTKK
ncbi:hypothetical protein CXG81DRAFT_9809 [Caulochytrium protostelioides]|uniref:HORMA domain-containing protein n=1 Tax=Caulochytrium protostelioides TaxID=1555241 RepID=A0A4V1IV93_9FUNG|nr:HORMA domain-containing protein [Caulochytrium protostelioides]RKP03259.1 hypothetical protein CXG81DRAFT_9809 [Caulochytrium protostelioides]|eukprot:RKP03259.1 hypothetical protein CXG81DRAFT_9809 [Caulochytrium protostelioides]